MQFLFMCNIGLLLPVINWFCFPIDCIFSRSFFFSKKHC